MLTLFKQHFFKEGFLLYFLTVLILLVHGTCLSLFDGNHLRLPRKQLNPVSFWLFFQSVSLIAVCKSSSGDL